MTALALWCTRHRLLVVLTWGLLLLGLGAGTVAKGSAYNSSFALSGTDSTQAQQLLDSAFPGQQGDTVSLVWHVESGTVRASSVQSSVDRVLTQYSSSPEVQSVQSPYSAGGSGQISADGKTAYASIDLDDATSGLSSAEADQLISIAHSADRAGLEVELGGSAVSGALQTPAEDSEIVGMAAAAIVLFLAFGSLFSMLLPILTAAAGVGGGLLGVGIDYALFIVTRHRRGLADGMPIDTSIGQAVTTSGRAVLFAGGTVCVALLGMLVLGIGFLDGVAIATALTVGVTVLAALTLLPALLSYLGPRSLSRRQRRRQGASTLSRVRAARLAAISVPRGLWDRWADIVHRRPRLLSLLALGLMLVLAIPTLSLRLGSADASTDPAGSTTHKAYTMLANGFGAGFNGPLNVVVKAANAQQQSQVGHLLQELQRTPGVAGAAESASVAQGGATIDVINVIPTSSPQSSATTDLLANLREHVIPGATSGTGLQAHVGGLVATNADFASVLSSKLPLFIAVIVGLSFLLLLLAFRSLLIPLTAAVMNLLAAAAAFGVVTAFFQWGWGSSSLGMGGSGPVEAFLPVMLIAILFGLSMDYQVFLVSRMHEDWVHNGDAKRAVHVGQAETGRVITAAAAIMICVFMAFVFGGQRVIAEFGIGLASAVALDAFVIRTVLVPAAMQVLGKANWWIPNWLDRIMPHLTVDPPDSPDAPHHLEVASEPDALEETVVH